MLIDGTNQLPRENLDARWKGVEMLLVYMRAATGRDAKGRPWISDEGWYFACKDCGNCGHIHKHGPTVVGEAVRHADYDHSEYAGAA